jgi:hypothetical protein
MAIRLPVVLAQHPRKSGVFSECEEGWITSLLFEERLDATLVAHLGSIEPDSTDHLCLEGLKGDFVLVSWETGSFVLDQLVRLGFGNFEIVPVDGSPKLTADGSSSHAKKIYLMGYNPDDEVSKSVARLKELLESKSTPVFQLQISPGKSVPNRSLPTIPLPTTPTVEQTVGKKHAASNPIAAAGRGTATFGGAPGHSPSSALEMNAKDDDDFPNIDLLVDERGRKNA